MGYALLTHPTVWSHIESVSPTELRSFTPQNNVMIDAEILQEMQAASIEERIAIIELILQSFKAELSTSTVAQTPAAQRYSIHPIPAQPLTDSSHSADEHLSRGTVRHYVDPYTAVEQPQRPAFGFMKDTGIILGDVVSPVIPESDWDVLQ